MAKNMYEKFRIMDDLLRTLNTNIVEERNLLGDLRSTSRVLEDLIKANDKTSRSSNNSSSRNNYSDNIKLMSENIITINDTLVEIRDILSEGSTQQRHSSANPLSNIGNSNSGSGSSGGTVANMSKYLSIAKGIFTALGISKLLGKLGQTADKSIAATYSFQQVSGLGQAAAYAYKSNVNNAFKGSNYTTGTEEYNRLAEIARSTGMDDPERLTLKYTKAIASGVESMSVDTSALSALLYTMEKRGTFTSTQLEGVTDLLYKYSAASGEITPEELLTSLQSSTDALIYGIQMSDEDRLKETKELMSVYGSLLDQGFNEDFVMQISDIINDLQYNKVNSQYYSNLSAIGVSGDSLLGLLSSGNVDEAASAIVRGLSQTSNTYGGGIAAYDSTLLSDLGISGNNELRYLLQNYDETLRVGLDDLAEQQGSAESAAQDMSRTFLDELGTKLENTFAPVIDWFADKGIGGSELGTAGALIGGGSLLKKGWNWLKGKGATSTADDAVKAAGSAMDDIAYSADDLARAFGTTTDDVVQVFGDAATYSADDIARAMGTSADDVIRTLGTSADDIAKGAGVALKGASKAFAAVGIILEAGISAYDAYQGFSAGDNREGWQEVGGGVGGIGGGLGGAAGGAALGTLIFPGVGTVIGGILGGIIGGVAGDAGGEALAEGVYDASASKTALTKEQLTQLDTYYANVSNLYSQYGNDAAQAYTLETAVPWLKSVGISRSITDKYNTDTGKPDFMKDYEAGKLFSYAQGTAFLPQDGLIYAHAGEAIIPAQYNPVNNVSSMRSLSNNMVDKDDITDIYDIIGEVKAVILDFYSLVEENFNREELDSKLKSGKLSVSNKKSLFDYL